MKTRLFFWIPFVLVSFNAVSSPDARSFALGNLHALDRAGSNPAVLSFLTEKELGFSVLNSFEMKELNTFNFYGQCPNPYLDAGWLISHYGYADYRIVQVQGGFAKKIFSELSAGVNLRYFYENSFLAEKVNYAWNADVGFRYQPNETFVFSLLTDNLLHTFPKDRWKIYGGVGYQATDQCWLAAEAFYDAAHQFNLSLGIEYEIVESLQVQLGIQTSTQMPSLGLAYQLNNWKIATGFAMHPTLGISSIVSMNYQF